MTEGTVEKIYTTVVCKQTTPHQVFQCVTHYAIINVGSGKVMENVHQILCIIQESNSYIIIMPYLGKNNKKYILIPEYESPTITKSRQHFNHICTNSKCGATNPGFRMILAYTDVNYSYMCSKIIPGITLVGGTN